MLAYARGEAAAFDVLYARHKGGVYRYLLRNCGNAGTADELFQDIWMNVIRVRATTRPPPNSRRGSIRSRITAWSTTGGRPVRRHSFRSTTTMKRRVRRSMRCPRRAPTSLMRVPDRREMSARIQAALAALPPAQRDAFLLQHESGMSLAEIAALTGVGMETVKSRLRYAIAKLRMELREELD